MTKTTTLTASNTLTLAMFPILVIALVGLVAGAMVQMFAVETVGAEPSRFVAGITGVFGIVKLFSFTTSLETSGRKNGASLQSLASSSSFFVATTIGQIVLMAYPDVGVSFIEILAASIGLLIVIRSVVVYSPSFVDTTSMPSATAIIGPMSDIPALDAIKAARQMIKDGYPQLDVNLELFFASVDRIVDQYDPECMKRWVCTRTREELAAWLTLEQRRGNMAQALELIEFRRRQLHPVQSVAKVIPFPGQFRHALSVEPQLAAA